jgi:hypothetical protein
MDLVLSMFSGRPDPSVRLTAATTEEILQAASLLPITNDEPLPDGLGYRGFVLRPAGQVGARERLHVFRDLVWDGDVTRRDSSRSLERHLYDLIAPTLEPGVRAAIDR